MTDKIVVLSACSSQDEARRIAGLLVERRLAACVNLVGGMRSVYRWQGAIEEAEEWLLVIKTRRSLFDALRTAIEQAHSYQVPEVVALPMTDGSAAYLEWLDKETGAGPTTR